MHQKKAASVLPLPVGADIRVCWPPATERQPPSWTSVGAWNAPENQARAAGENRSKTGGMDFSLSPRSAYRIPPWILISPVPGQLKIRSMRLGRIRRFLGKL